MPRHRQLPHVRALATALALSAFAPLVQAQTACGHWEPLLDGLLGDIAGVQTRAQGLAVFDAGDARCSTWPATSRS